jgi:hypothetical protein
MEQLMTDATKGRFRAYINPEASHDNAQPAFRGKVVYPLSSQERPLALWAHKTRKGHIMLSGKAAESAAEQMAKLVEPPKPVIDADKIKVAEKNGAALELKPNEILLFTNIHKDDDHPDRPDFWGYHHDGTSKLFKIALWQRTNDSGQVYLTGNLEFTDGSREPENEPERELEA